MSTNKKHSLPDPRIIGAAALAVFSVFQVGYQFGWKPIQEKQQLYADLEAEVARAERARREERALGDRWFHVQDQSFSSDPTLLAHHYQQWLLQRTASMPGLSVIPETPVREGDIGWQVGFGIEGIANANWIAALIEEVERLPLMHHITLVDLERAPESGYDQVGFRLNLVALALRDAESKTQWPTDLYPMEGNEQNLSRLLAQLQPFRQGYAGPPPKIVSAPRNNPQPVKPRIDPLQSVNLVGSVEIEGIAQAWIVDQRSKQEFFLKLDEEIELADFSAKVVSIDADHLELATADGNDLRWPLGKSLRSIVSE